MNVSPHAEQLGFDPTRLEKAGDLVQQAIDQGAFPGAVALVGRHGSIAALWATGSAELAPERRAMAEDTIFDLASLTKVIAGTTAALIMLEDGAWSLDNAVASFIPEFAAHGKEEVTIRHL